MDKRKSLYDLLIEKATDLGWSTYRDDDGDLEFSKYSPAGEDFSFYVGGEDVVREVCEVLHNFDPDEHAAMWVEARGRVAGVPGSIRTLVDDADAIEEMIEELYYDLLEVEKAFYEDEEA